MSDLQEALTSERLKLLYAYWLSKRPSPESLPGRQHLDPLDIPAILPWILMFDVGAHPGETRYRLVGTEVVDQVGRDYTGRLLSEGYWGQDTARVLEDYWDVAQRGVPVVWHRRLVARDGKPHAYEYLLLPLAKDGVHVNILLAAVAFEEWA